jgi:hypothetical protein
MKPELEEILQHHGVKGMKWGVRRSDEQLARASKIRDKAEELAYATGAKINPRELKYGIKRAMARKSETDKAVANMVQYQSRKSGVLTSNTKLIEAVDRAGVQAHKDAKYSNLTKEDINRFKRYTDSAAYSRAINGHLAIGKPPDVKDKAKDLKDSLRKNSVNNQTVYRSTALKFSTEGLSKKLDAHGEDKLSEIFDTFDKNFKGKSFKENRVYSTSTSPSFAIDTWRKVNPNAAKSYNSYLVINCKNTPGILADGRTSDGKKLVNTRSNQEGILAPNKMTYRKIAWDKDRKMFAVHMDAE